MNIGQPVFWFFIVYSFLFFKLEEDFPVDSQIFDVNYIIKGGAVCGRVFMDNINEKGSYEVKGMLREAPAFLKTIGIDYRITPLQTKKIKSIPPFKEKIASKFDELYGDVSGIVKGIALGIKPKNDPYIDSIFRNSGLYHMLVASGQNIAFIWAAVTPLLIFFRYRYIYYITGMVLSFLYTYTVGFEPPIVRAFIMSSLTLLAYILKRRAVALNALSISGIIILIFDKNSVTDLSFILSFLATAGIILILERFFHIVKGRAWIFVVPVVSTIGALLMILPFLVNTFNYIVLLAPLSNLSGSLPAEAVLTASFIGLIFPFFSSFVVLSAKILFYTAYFFSEILPSSFYIPSQPVYRFVFYYITVFSFLYGLKFRYVLFSLVIFLFSFLIPHKKSLIVINSMESRYPVLIDRKILVGDLNYNVEKTLLRLGVKSVYHIAPEGAIIKPGGLIRVKNSIKNYVIETEGRSIYIKGDYSFVWGYGENSDARFYFLRNKSMPQLENTFLILKTMHFLPSCKYIVLDDIKFLPFLELFP